MVVRTAALMGIPGGVYVVGSWVALGACAIGILGQHPTLMCCFATPLLLTVWGVGWIIDQARWMMPVVFSALPSFSDREVWRAKIYMAVSGMCKAVATGMWLFWLWRSLATAAAGSVW